MNAKKNKNKNRPNKPPNPNPPQNVEELSTVIDKIDYVLLDEKAESAPKVDERVPEIISEVVTPAVTETKETEDESPKKPKRNRGKKKKQDKEFEDQDEILPEVVMESTIESVEAVREIIPEGPNVAPNARKKKNKNKKPNEIESGMSEKTESVIAEKTIDKLEFLVKEEHVSEETEQELKPKKKNKKKKNRQDSEKSEKSEEISCTAAFQKLIKDEKVEVNLSETEMAVKKEDYVAEKIIEQVIQDDVTDERSNPIIPVKELTTEPIKETFKQQNFEVSGKNKKKNRKERNNPPKEEEKIDNKNVSEIATESVVPIFEKPVLKEQQETIDISLTHIEQQNLPVVVKNIPVDDETTKTKAKIAKPVERNRKGKNDNQMTEKEQLPALGNVPFEEKPLKLPPEVTTVGLKDETNIHTQEIESVEKDMSVKIEKKAKLPLPELRKDETPVPEVLPEEIEHILPEEEIAKKRKKSPKPKKNRTPQSSESENTLQTKPIEVIVCDSKKVEISIDAKIIPQDEFTAQLSCEQMAPEEMKDPTSKDSTLVQPDSKLFDNKSKKKRKKSPRLPTGTETSTKSEIKTEEGFPSSSQDVKAKEPQKDSAQGSAEKTDTFFKIQHSTDDVEICSLKADESEGSTCGVTPDIIQYPRATSQDLIDDNNNMMLIQEITTVEATKLNINLDIPDMPFIQGSGETPLDMPESIMINVTTLETRLQPEKQSEPEKTDIKSKMMEVNQDMEELRLSIEKSLAELTAIEKGEKETEKSYTDTVLHITEEPKPVEVKLSMPSEMIAKSSTEKMHSGDSQEQKHKNITLKDILSDIKTSAESIPVPPLLPIGVKEVSKETDEKASTDMLAASISLTVNEPSKSIETVIDTPPPPICPARKDQKGKGKSKKKGKQDSAATVTPTSSVSIPSEAKEQPKDNKDQPKTQEKSDQKTSSGQEKGKQQSTIAPSQQNETEMIQEKQLPESEMRFDPIESFEDAMTSSADDINKTFELIANDQDNTIESSHVNPEINIIAPIEDTRKESRDAKVNPLSQPKNFLGHPDIPVPSNRIDYKKEKNKIPNEVSAKVKIKDAIEIESKKHSKESQTDNIKKFMKTKSIDESFSVTNENDEFIYKYSFRKVFLQNACHVCKKGLKQARIPCSFCNLVFYCNGKHKDEDWTQHQALCFAVSTIVHLKDQKHIYADSKNITGQDYRLLRMQMIISCEKVLKRKLVPWEQEALLYPRICADPECREWRQSKLVDCDGCGQISYCADHPQHFPKSHQRWCKSYSLYQKLVVYQQTKGRLEPKMPSKSLNGLIPEKMNEVLASMYEEKIDMNDIQYAALTQIATAPLTAAYCHQMFSKSCIQTNGAAKKTTCTIHVVGAELQFEADALNKWEVFFLHLRPAVQELRVVLISADLNPSNLPLDLLRKVKLCENCQMHHRRVVFSFQDKKTYQEYRSGEEFIAPDIVCSFNASIARSAIYSKDSWPKAINCILKQRVPFAITSYTLSELQRDLARVKEVAETKYTVIVEPKNNNFAAVRPDRNFISDDDMPLLFKNYCLMLLCGG